MAKPFADGDNAHAAVDQCSRMTVAELVQATRDPCFDTITCPPFLNGLIAQGGATTVFFSAKQRAMPIAARCQVHFELMDQTWIIQQNRTLSTAFAMNEQVLAVKGQIQVLDIEVERLTDT